MNYQTELRHLYSFLVLSEELHFRKAAEKLFLSQPGLSKQIQSLENQLGVSLLDRNQRNVRLTPCGHYLKQQVEILNGFLTKTSEKLKHIAEGTEGELQIGFVGSAMQQVIPQLIKTCNTKLPNIHFEFNEMANHSQIEALQKHQLDLGFVRLDKSPEGIHLDQIAEEHFSLVIPKDHPIHQKTFTSVKQFSEDSFILFSSDYSSTYYTKIMSIFSDAGFYPKVSHKSIHANTIFRLVENGLGVAIVPHSLTLDVGKSIGIKVIQLTSIPQKAILSIAWNKERKNPMLENVLSCF